MGMPTGLAHCAHGFWPHVRGTRGRLDAQVVFLRRISHSPRLGPGPHELGPLVFVHGAGCTVVTRSW